MDRSAYERREEAWRAFHQWEDQEPIPERPLSELLAWVDDALALARRALPLSEEPIEEKAERIARARAAFAIIKTR